MYKYMKKALKKEDKTCETNESNKQEIWIKVFGQASTYVARGLHT